MYLAGDYNDYFGNFTYLQLNISRCDNKSKGCRSDEDY